MTASRGPSDDGNLTEWRSDIIARCKADKEVAARRKARPEPLIPSYSVTGFGAPLARGNCGTELVRRIQRRQ